MVAVTTTRKKSAKIIQLVAHGEHVQRFNSLIKMILFSNTLFYITLTTYITLSNAATTEEITTEITTEQFNKTNEDIVLIGANGAPVLANHQPPGKVLLYVVIMLDWILH